MTDTPASMSVPLLDLKAQYDSLRDEIEPVVRDVVESQWFILGPKVQELEKALADYCEVEHVIGCSSGTDAILLALMALDIGPGDEVICPPYTFFATASTIARVGAKPVFADIDPVTYNCPVESIAAAAEQCSNLKAIMPVHLFGQTVDMNGYLELADQLNVPVIEDAAQAIGARDAQGKSAGSCGAIGCFSFFPSKNLGGFGDGGFVTTNDVGLAEKIEMLRVHGMKPKYVHKIIGINGRLDAMQAAVLLVKLPHLESWHDGRRSNAAKYDALFADAGAFTSGEDFSAGGFPLRTPQPPQEPARHIYNQYVIRVPAEIRDDVRAFLSERKISTEIYYPIPLHLQECFAYLGHGEGEFPNAEQAAEETIALPIYPELTEAQLQYVAQNVIAAVEKYAAAKV